MTNLGILVNYVDATVEYQTTQLDYILLDLIHDYLIWTAGSTVVTDLMIAEPTPPQLNAAATIIDPLSAVTVALCLLMDYSHMGGKYTRKVKKDDSTHLDNLRYVFAFSFDGATATIPQLEAWDDSTHASFVKNVLGLGTANNSMVKGVCTTSTPPGTGWLGTPLAGSVNVLLLNNIALPDLGSGITSQELYANLKIVIPANYANPAVETFVLTTRYTYAS